MASVPLSGRRRYGRGMRGVVCGVPHMHGVRAGVVTNLRVAKSQTPRGWLVAAGSKVMVICSDWSGCSHTLQEPDQPLRRLPGGGHTEINLHHLGRHGGPSRRGYLGNVGWPYCPTSGWRRRRRPFGRSTNTSLGRSAGPTWAGRTCMTGMLATGPSPGQLPQLTADPRNQAGDGCRPWLTSGAANRGQVSRNPSNNWQQVGWESARMSQ